ncbi:O-antigen ligase family protein [Azospirillum sp. sgz302134]
MTARLREYGRTAEDSLGSRLSALVSGRIRGLWSASVGDAVALFAVLCLAIRPPALGAVDSGIKGVVIFCTLNALLFAYAAVRALRCAPDRLARQARSASLALLLVGLGLLSTLWSANPRETALWSTMQLVVTGTLLCLSSLVPPARTVRTLGLVACLLIGVSVLVVALFPGRGTMSNFEHAGAWRGIFYDKNGLGRMLAMFLPALLVCVFAAKGWLRAVFAVGLMAGLLLTAKASSATATVVVAGVFGIAVLKLCFIWSRALGRALVLGGVLAAVAGAVVIATSADAGAGWLFEVLGRDESFSGREPIWDFAAWHIVERPLLGWGLGAFWTEPVGTKSLFTAFFGFNPFHAHNGFVEITLGLGLVGLGLSLAVLTHLLAISLPRFLRSRTLATDWPFLALLAFVGTNLMESEIGRLITSQWPLLLCAYFQALARRTSSR